MVKLCIFMFRLHIETKNLSTDTISKRKSALRLLSAHLFLFFRSHRRRVPQHEPVSQRHPRHRRDPGDALFPARGQG